MDRFEQKLSKLRNLSKLLEKFNEYEIADCLREANKGYGVYLELQQDQRSDRELP